MANNDHQRQIEFDIFKVTMLGMSALVMLIMACLYFSFGYISGSDFEGASYLPEAVVSVNCNGAEMDLVRYKKTSGAFRFNRYQSLASGNPVRISDASCIVEVKETLWDWQNDRGAEMAKSSPAPGGNIKFDLKDV